MQFPTVFLDNRPQKIRKNKYSGLDRRCTPHITAHQSMCPLGSRHNIQSLSSVCPPKCVYCSNANCPSVLCNVQGAILRIFSFLVQLVFFSAQTVLKFRQRISRHSTENKNFLLLLLCCKTVLKFQQRSSRQRIRTFFSSFSAAKLF